jgi:hypothetical protein
LVLKSNKGFLKNKNKTKNKRRCAMVELTYENVKINWKKGTKILKGFVFDTLHDIKILVVDDFLSKAKKLIRQLTDEDKFRLANATPIAFEKWVESILALYYNRLTAYGRYVHYSLVNVSLFEITDSWVCLHNAEEFIKFCKAWGYFDKIVQELQKVLQKEVKKIAKNKQKK